MHKQQLQCTIGSTSAQQHMNAYIILHLCALVPAQSAGAAEEAMQ
jgi:hypothetical protein